MNSRFNNIIMAYIGTTLNKIIGSRDILKFNPFIHLDCIISRHNCFELLLNN